MILPPLFPFLSESRATDAGHVAYNVNRRARRFDQLAELGKAVWAKRSQTMGFANANDADAAKPWLSATNLLNSEHELVCYQILDNRRR